MTMRRDQFLTRTVLKPYPKGRPTFTLIMWDTYQSDGSGYMAKTRLGYQLMASDTGVIFRGEDFSASPCHAIDSEECVRALLGFLSLRPGDTDDSYFEEYTPEQMAFAQAHGEMLSLYAMDEEPQPFEEFEVL
jgi:hypothetical protein